MITIEPDQLRKAINYIQRGLDAPNNNAHKALARIWLDTLRDYMPETLEEYETQQGTDIAKG